MRDPWVHWNPASLLLDHASWGIYDATPLGAGVPGGPGRRAPVGGSDDRRPVGAGDLGLILHAAVLLHARERPRPFHPLTTVLVGACLAGPLSRDLFNLYVLLDLTSLLALVLIALERRWQAMWAGFQYLIL
ncbi:MAG: hypothetical protein ACUVQS_00965, partial [Candidatus Bipolaricaulaceae bacterium]